MDAPILLDTPPTRAGGLIPVDGEPLIVGRRGQIEATESLVDGIRYGALDRGSVREGLRNGRGPEAPGITPGELGAILARHIREGSERAQSRAMECAVRLYSVCAEEVQALRTLIGADSGGGDTHNHLHMHTQDPEVARVLAVAVRDPEVMAALDRAVARQASQAVLPGDPRS